MTKVTVDIKQNNKARNIFLALLLCACVALYFLWGSYSQIKADLVKSTENALNELKLKDDSIKVNGIRYDSVMSENATLKLDNNQLLSEAKKQDAKDKKELQKVENLSPSEQIGLFARITNCEVLQSGNIALVPIEGIKTANVLMTEGDQAKNKINRLNEIIDNRNNMIRNDSIADSQSQKTIKTLKTERSDLLNTVIGQDVIIDKQDKRIKTQKTVVMVSGIVSVLMTIVAIIK